MDITSLGPIGSEYLNQIARDKSLIPADEESFSSILSAAMDMVGETNRLQNVASAEEIRFALGEAENTHDMVIAETKALTAMQYTTAIRDKAIEAYREIMNMQI